VTKYLTKQLKRRENLFWVMVLKVLVLHSREVVVKQRNSHHGNQEAERMPTLASSLLSSRSLIWALSLRDSAAHIQGESSSLSLSSLETHLQTEKCVLLISYVFLNSIRLIIINP
jgi:hypothetical protein